VALREAPGGACRYYECPAPAPTIRSRRISSKGYILNACGAE